MERDARDDDGNVRRACASYGAWPSPVDSRGAASSSLRLDAGGPPPHWDVAGNLVWLEGRPDEGGRGVLCGPAGDITPPGVNVKSRVHEYGGGAWGVVGRRRDPPDNALGNEQGIVFSKAEGGLWFSKHGEDALLEVVAGGRFADFGEDGGGRARVVCVRETEGDACHAVVAVGLGAGCLGEVQVLASGADFYAAPTVSEDGKWAAWIEWDHPCMPWDGTRLVVCALDGVGRVVEGERHVVAGGQGESCFQPRWAPRHGGGTAAADPLAVLGFCSDREGGWSNLWTVEVSGSADGGIKVPRRITKRPSEYGGTAPGWRLGEATWGWAVAPGGRLKALAVRCGPDEGGAVTLSLVDPFADVEDDDHEVDLWVPFDGVSGISAMASEHSRSIRVAVTGSSARRPTVVAEASMEWDAEGTCLAFVGAGDGDGGGEDADHLKGSGWRVQRWASPETALPRAFVSVPELVEFPTTESEGGVTAWMWLYLPRSATHRGRPGEKPPLLLRAHGGPTACASSALDQRTQYWTTRGYAVADVDYGGSSGYGRAYRERLAGNWGVVDVADCCAAAGFLATRGLVDPERMAITGGSAGGFTALACLAFRPGVFQCGASHYGIGDLSLLARHTHKFEARYLDSLLGSIDEDLYRERSPVSKADSIRAPVIFFQGELDEVVPPEQAEIMHAAVARQGIATELVVFPGERHGFLVADHIAACLDRQHAFFASVFGHSAGAEATATLEGPAPPVSPKKDD